MIDPQDTAQLEEAQDRLLAPLPQHGGAGIALRYEAVYARIQEARRQDDDSVPMGDWERPLDRADWRGCAALCAEALATQGKDLQVAAWLCEAWMRVDGLPGLLAGIRVLDGLVARYWDTAWPRIDEDGDADARCAPFIWLDTTLSLACALHVPLLRVDGAEPFDLNLDGWERAVVAGPVDVDDAGPDALPGRDEIMACADHPANRARLLAIVSQADPVADAWRRLGDLLDERLGQDAPSLRRTSDALARLARTAAGMMPDLQAPVTCGAQTRPASGYMAARDDGVYAHDAARGSSWTDAHAATSDWGGAADDVHDGSLTIGGPSDGSQTLGGHLAGRSHAYRELARIADYLAAIEPHSPTPYLLRQAVAWGGMSLAELMRELMQDEGGFARYMAMLNER